MTRHYTMAARYDYEGRKFHSLTGIRRLEESYFRSHKWLWRCDCGGTLEAFSRDVMMGRKKTCGCVPTNYKTNFIGDGVAAFNAIYRRYKKEAAKRDYAFELDVEDVAYLTKQNCHYCGKSPSTISNTRHDTGNYIYNGIDRVDNTKGYYIDNVVSCCRECNYSKRDRGYFQFVDWAHKISGKFISAGVS